MNIAATVRSNKSRGASIGTGVVTTILIATFLVSSLPARVAALVKFDFEQYYFNERPTAVLDHCVVDKDGIYHLFYLRGNPAVNIGHATTTDFRHWKLESPILAPGTWDTRLWAPHLITSSPGSWILYYTGVNAFGAQQTGIAASINLYDWFKYPWPVYHPDPVWAQWDESVWSHGRDPHVIENDGMYYMFLTAKTADNRGAVACAVSTDAYTWTDIGPVFVNDTWHVLESVFVMKRNGKFHMFFTEEEIYGTSHMFSDSLLSGWDLANRRIIDTGHAPQVTRLPDGTEMFSRHAVYDNGYGENFHTIRFDTLAWVGDIPAPYKPWALAGDWNLIWGNAFAYQPVFRNNPAARGDNVADTFQGDCWLGTYERYTGPCGFGTPGSFQGDSRTGVLRSRTFTVTGNSMNLLVGGGSDPALVYVALVNASTLEVLFRETGRDSEEMDRRYWDLRPHAGKEVYIEIADLSTGGWGHINCDDINESMDVVESDGGDGGTTAGGRNKKETGVLTPETQKKTPGKNLVLRQNSPNPFNPATTIAYELPAQGTVTLRIYDVGGKLVRNLVDAVQPEGRHTITWSGVDDAGRRAVSGVYLYRLTFKGAVVDTKKMLMLK
jgi:hypothetical protein